MGNWLRRAFLAALSITISTITAADSRPPGSATFAVCKRNPIRCQSKADIAPSTTRASALDLTFDDDGGAWWIRSDGTVLRNGRAVYGRAALAVPSTRIVTRCFKSKQGWCGNDPNFGPPSTFSGSDGDLSKNRGCEVCTLDRKQKLRCNDTTWPGKFIDVVAGSDLVCGLRPSGQIQCRVDDEMIALVGSYTQLAAGDSYVCALEPIGHAKCWSIARAIRGPSMIRFEFSTSTFRQLVASGSSTCGLTLPGKVECLSSDFRLRRWTVDGRFTRIAMFSGGRLCGVSADSGEVHCPPPPP